MNCQILNTNLEKKLQTHEKNSKNLRFFYKKCNCFAILNLFFILYPLGFHLLLSRLRREKFAECSKVFGSNPKGFELLKIYLAMFLRTSSLKRLHLFRAAENIPCCVQKNTTPKLKFVVCNWGATIA